MIRSTPHHTANHMTITHHTTTTSHHSAILTTKYYLLTILPHNQRATKTRSHFHWHADRESHRSCSTACGSARSAGRRTDSSTQRTSRPWSSERSRALGPTTCHTRTRLAPGLQRRGDVDLRCPRLAHFWGEYVEALQRATEKVHGRPFRYVKKSYIEGGVRPSAEAPRSLLEAMLSHGFSSFTLAPLPLPPLVPPPLRSRDPPSAARR